ncbi:G-type lectin S-receptor-like serine/threonine-protein kinase At2g19130 [Herrania umbratica]|uniref:Receptor-like serine/threonine-protein kinase n=1 Tax=Herrania umbratica TaxID=108875 RepID=A0A6J1APA9_9ROSI|nr:G-type lectin S-receptor-like serine/threonine-protein kinase At2g19130 [Herrania umbratica]
MGNRTKLLPSLHVLILYFLSFLTYLSIEMDTIYPGQSLSGNQTITSENGWFELGFFKPGNSSHFYVGIWYKKLPGQTVVWVANRDIPLLDPSTSKLQLSEKGNLVLCNRSEIPLWSAESSANSINSTVAVLEDSGNLVLRNSSNASVIQWQSFDHPTDTWLPGAKLGINKMTKKGNTYISWSNSNDPATGPFSLGLDPNGTSTYFILQNGKRHWTCGMWLERVSSFSTDTVTSEYSTVSYESTEKENFYSYSVTNSSIPVRYVMDISGQLQQLVWQDDSMKWLSIWAKPKDQCEIYAFCGAYGACNQFSSRTRCKCLDGFEPKIPGQWNSGNYSHGCTRRTPLQCNKGEKDGFQVISNIRIPANDVPLTNAKSLEECKSACLRDCSCTACTFHGNCSIWREDLLNIQYLSFGDYLGRDLYLRLPMTELPALKCKTRGRIEWFTINAAAAIVISIAILGLLVSMCRRKIFSDTKPIHDVLILFKFSDLKSATKNFSEKLGEGGFGSVFKGTLPNSVAIAVKSLKCLDQEEKQFRTELSTIGTIHHVNLVRLLGFSVKGKKRFLVYECMPNGSLDSHLFYKDSKILDWKTRYHIALGIARGLAYLHDKCRECIIHCDIKPENILLDADYNPILSDFGLAKLLGRDFSRVLTTMKGTRGYLAPEMISGDPITPKSDVFSYGMLLLEIISGRRNWEIRLDGPDAYFPACAANSVSNGGDVLSLLDSKLQGNANAKEVIRTCRVACWCIQDEEERRPSMGNVVQIFEGVQEVNMPPIPRFIQTITNYTKNAE